MRFVAPLKVRKLKAQIVLKGLSLGEVVRRAKVNYTAASSVLSGKRIDETTFKKLKETVEKAPMPGEGAE